jgi:hypothetical protein
MNPEQASPGSGITSDLDSDRAQGARSWLGPSWGQEVVPGSNPSPTM